MPEPTTTAQERDAKRRAIAKARAAVAEGQVVSDEKMTAWLDSWGAPNELPSPSNCD